MTNKEKQIADKYHTEQSAVALEGLYEYAQSHTEDEDAQWMIISRIARRLIDNGVQVIGSHGEANDADDFEPID